MNETPRRGTVIRKYKHHYIVEVGDEEMLCGISSKLRKRLEYPEADPASRRQRVQAVRSISAVDPVVVGDEVLVEPGEEISMIMEVLPRRTTLSREAPGRRHLEQVIAANIDQVIVVVSAQAPPFREDLLDRVLCGAEYQELGACICLNKIDLGVPPEVSRMVSIYPSLGYPVIETSALTEEGIEHFRKQVRGKTSVAIGLSGVGKTSLINALEPGLGLRVAPVNRRTGLGRHTTTTLSLLRLGSGGHIVDAPGLRELGIWEIAAEDIPHLFPEFRPMQGRCRFGNTCAHDREPGCAVKDAVERGLIAPHRYASYLTIRKEIEAKEPRY